MERIDSLDTIKGLALLAVVIIHIRGNFLTTQGLDNGFFDLVLFSISRFGVPVFFLTSGFLLKKKFEERSERQYTKNYIRKLVFYYILATSLYFILQISLLFIEANTGLTLPRDISMETSLIDGLYEFLYTGTIVRGSLWFFSALAISTGLIYISEKFSVFNALLGLSIIFHIVGILANSYQVIGLNLPARDPLFFGLVFTSIGFKLAEKNLDRITDYSVEIAGFSAIFLLLNIVENMLLMGSTGISFVFQDYSFFTLPFALSVFLLALSKPGLGSDTRFNVYGKFTLLGYIFHQITGGLLTGLIMVAGSLIGFNLSANPVLNLFAVIFAYIITMELVTYYRKSGLDKARITRGLLNR